MMGFSSLDMTIDGRGVAVLTLNRPASHNALDGTLIAELVRAAEQLGRDENVRAVVLAAAGPSFCAGGDLGWMREQMGADRQTRMARARELAGLFQTLNTMPRPLIGRVQGQAFGGGLGLLCVCDSVVAADTARFGFTETRLGLIPATISPYVVARIGEAMSRRVMLSARLFDAGEAVRLGLVGRAVAPGDLDAAVEAEILPYLATAPGAVGRAKALVRRLGAAIDPAVIEATVVALADTWETEEAREGLAAFFDKRRPRWAQRED